MSSYSYSETVARFRAECEECAVDAGRPEHVSLLSWHEWGHCYEGAPDTSHPHCRCGSELKSSPRFWHCGGCHETFSGERSFMRHRRGSGAARYCLDVRNGAGGQHWRTAGGLWGYGPRRDFQATPEASARSVELVPELTA